MNQSGKNCKILTSLMIKLPQKLGISIKEANRMARINIYKYKNNDSVPLVLSIFSFCDAFNLDSGWLFSIVEKISRQELSENNALEILSNWSENREVFEIAVNVALIHTLKKQKQKSLLA